MWQSVEEFRKWVPLSANESLEGSFNAYRRESAYVRILETAQHFEQFVMHIDELQKAVDAKDVDGCKSAFLDAVYEGEEFFLYCESAARIREADDVFHHFPAADQIDRYAQSSRLLRESQRFVKHAERFFQVAREHFNTSADFVIDGIYELPEAVRSHFMTARDLISIEEYEMGMLSALRGLEGTLREVFRRQRTTHAHIRDGATLGDLINVARGFRWARDGQAVLPERIAHLLQFLRIARNAAAHSGPEAVDDWREHTRLALAHAKRLWASSQKGRRRIAPPPVPANRNQRERAP